MTLVLFLAFVLSWHDPNVPPCDAFKLYRDGALIATVAGTSYLDTTALDATRYSYKIVAVRGGESSAPSPSRSSLALRWNQGVVDTMWYGAARDSVLLFVCLPWAPPSWYQVNWAYGSSEHVIFHTNYDLTFDNQVNLSDLVFFGGLPGKRTFNECRGMLNIYGANHQARMEWQR